MFKSELIVKRDVSNDNAWIVQEPLVWEDDAYEIKVLRGFDFDFASIPKIITNILPKNGQEYDRAACLHDALYAGEVFEREMCDEIFLKAMESDGVSYAKRYAMYWAVKAAGGLVWKKHKADDVEFYKQFVEVSNAK